MFNVGAVYFTHGIVEKIGDGAFTKQDVIRSVVKHETGDFGLTDPHDVQVNMRSINEGYGTVMSEFILNGIRVWIITTLHEDEELISTTCLLPSEY